MIVYRLSQFKYANDLSGKGAELFGGRWNSIGNAMLYTASSRALAMTEVLVNLLGNSVSKLTYAMVAIEINNIKPLDIAAPSKLPKNWDEIPHNESCQLVGDKFLKANKFIGLKVPSAVVKGDFNFVFNPKHKNYKSVKVKEVLPFDFDNRLVRF